MKLLSQVQIRLLLTNVTLHCLSVLNMATLFSFLLQVRSSWWILPFPGKKERLWGRSLPLPAAVEETPRAGDSLALITAIAASSCGCTHMALCWGFGVNPTWVWSWEVIQAASCTSPPRRAAGKSRPTWPARLMAGLSDLRSLSNLRDSVILWPQSNRLQLLDPGHRNSS